MALIAAASTESVFWLSCLRAAILRANEAGAPRRKRACPRLLSNDPQRGLKMSNTSTLIQGIKERIKLTGPSCRLPGLSIPELYLRYMQAEKGAYYRSTVNTPSYWEKVNVE
jgi:hypothetical protein